MKRLILLLCLLLSTAAFGEEGFPRDYYDGLKDGLSVDDLEKLTSLDEEQKQVAKALLYYFQNYPRAQLIQCGSHLKDLGTASEMWTTDNDGRCAEDANSLYPSYLLFAPSCPTTDLKPYQYSLKDGVYHWVCPGDHSTLGIDPPTYNGTQGLDWGEPQPTEWHLVSYTSETPDPQFAPNLPRVSEIWASHGRNFEYLSQLELDASHPAKVSRCWGLTSENVSIRSNSEFIELLDSNLLSEDFATESALLRVYSKMSPATVGMIIVDYLTNPEYADSLKRLKKSLEKKSEEA